MLKYETMESLLEEYIKKENNLFQSEIWDKYQKNLEHETFWIDCNDNNVLVVKLHLFNKFSYLYCPRAPRTTFEGWHLFMNKVREIAKRERCIFIRIEPFTVPGGVLKELHFKKVGKYSPMSKQFSPMNTLLLDINKPEEKLLEEMKPKWRYNIKLATKKGVTVRQSKERSDLAEFCRLSNSMVKRGYHCFDEEHYQKLMDALGEKHATMFVAEHEKEILTVIIVTFYDKVATYLHGTSSDSKRELMPNHLAQWEAIKEAKKRGCEIYDFWGVAPEDEKNHSWNGITRFKLGFGGERVSFLGAYDYTFSKIWYIMFSSINFMRKIVKR